jgi:hypothetical protein
LNDELNLKPYRRRTEEAPLKVKVTIFHTFRREVPLQDFAVLSKVEGFTPIARISFSIR